MQARCDMLKGLPRSSLGESPLPPPAAPQPGHWRGGGRKRKGEESSRLRGLPALGGGGFLRGEGWDQGRLRAAGDCEDLVGLVACL